MTNIGRWSLTICLFGLLLCQPLTAATAAPHVSAVAAVLLDGESGTVLYERNAYQARPPASTTKIVTAILGFEYGDVQDEVVVSDKAGNTGEASINLYPGERVALGDLLTGALVRSGNDACVSISEHVAGSEEFFTLWMTAKSRVLGGRSSQFYNTNGLPHKKHWTSAYDLAVIARHAMKNPQFSATVKQKNAFLNNRDGWPKKISNTNALLWSYPFADGVKTGTTDAAGQCLVASATKNNRQLIAVVLRSNDRFGDCMRLFEYGFSLPGKSS
ncbi:D-alanyl-D-alanine carboxypeptidase family protein [Heliobacterium mobile]|uniref:D-alanyl-D-alanine carboxypeptidase family protein n=1 Tax=Heliobacterium mobile TaxID=28064 RepID=UPI0014788C97|nr:D-alanyl-D-alanine carboxypeptidase family protein [Heliobacterium mobile]